MIKSVQLVRAVVPYTEAVAPSGNRTTPCYHWPGSKPHAARRYTVLYNSAAHADEEKQITVGHTACNLRMDVNDERENLRACQSRKLGSDRERYYFSYWLFGSSTGIPIAPSSNAVRNGTPLFFSRQSLQQPNGITSWGAGKGGEGATRPHEPHSC